MKPIQGIKKKIIVDDCVSSCPIRANCKAWNNLTKQEKFFASCGVGVPKFILDKCELEDI